MRGVVNLSLDTAHELPSLIKCEIPTRLKIKIFIDYFKISLKLFTVHRIKKQTRENILGFDFETFDYGALHFLFREIFIKNTYFVKENRNNKIKIMDCGSNIGLSILYFKILFPFSIIHGFEPDPETFRLLELNIKRNRLKNVYLHNVALYDKAGDILFYVDHNNPGWLTMTTVKSRLPDKDVIKVKSVKLSNYINGRVDIVKMDIEGAESKVIEDLIKSTKIKKVENMAIEFHLFRNNSVTFLDFLKNIIKEGFIFSLSAEAPKRNVTVQDVMVYLTRA